MGVSVSDIVFFPFTIVPKKQLLFLTAVDIILGCFVSFLRSLRAQGVIDALPVHVHSESAPGAYDSMCIFCQDEYAAQDEVRVLPCKHGFHKTCVDEWLLANNSCPLCKVAVAPDEDEAEAKPPAPGLFN
jgi:hypothetical protein